VHCTIEWIAVENVEFGKRVNLTVAGQVYPVISKQVGGEEERLLRKAATRIEQKMIEYRQKHAKSVGEKDLLAMVAIEMARDLVILEEKNDTKPFIQKIQELTTKIEDYLQVK